MCEQQIEFLLINADTLRMAAGLPYLGGLSLPDESRISQQSQLELAAVSALAAIQKKINTVNVFPVYIIWI